MLCLSRKDLEKLADCRVLTDVVSEAMVISMGSDYTMPLRSHVEHEGNTLLLMPCFQGSRFGVKLVSIFPENREKGLPVIEGMVVLNNGTTGAAESMMNGAALTAWRTGAVGGAGLVHTVEDKPVSIGLIGAGVQGYYQLLFAASLRTVKSINIYDSLKRDPGDFVSRIKHKFPEIPVKVHWSSSALVEESDVIICATSSTEPVIPDSRELVKGKSFIGIGSYRPDMRELPEAVFRELECCYVDTLHAKDETGDLITPVKEGWIDNSQIKNLGELIRDGVKPAGGTTLFKSVGMALFDLKVAEQFYIDARKCGTGTEVEF